MRIFSLLLSAVIFLSSFGGNIPELIFSGVTGIPFFSDSVNDSIVEEADEATPIVNGTDSGYLPKLLCVFIDSSATVFEKYRIFKENGLLLVGWCCLSDLYVVRCNAAGFSELLELGKRLQQSEKVLYAGPVMARRITDDSTPNDPFDPEKTTRWNENSPSGSNWWLEAINARQAWDYDYLCSNITVGVVDSGFYVKHPDLWGKITFPSKAEALHNIPASHGTHVAGIITANRNNEIGVSGIVDQCSLVCVDWSYDEGQWWINDLHILFGISTCIKAGSKVVNCSFGCSANLDGEKNTALHTAYNLDAWVYSALMSSLLSKGYDFVVVQSAGNGNDDSRAVDTFYNGTFCSINEKTVRPTKLSVSAQDILDRIIIVSSATNSGGGNYVQAYYSNVGDGVSIAAPGGSVYSCVTEGDGLYGYKSGTSMAAPVVTGTAALVWSANPTLTGAQVKDVLLSTTSKKVAPYPDVYFEESKGFEYPLIDANAAIEKALSLRFSMAHVKGRVSVSGTEVSSIVLSKDDYNNTFTVLPDGSFDFVIAPGNYTYSVCKADGTSVLNGSVSVTEDITDLSIT